MLMLGPYRAFAIARELAACITPSSLSEAERLLALWLASIEAPRRRFCEMRPVNHLKAMPADPAAARCVSRLTSETKAKPAEAQYRGDSGANLLLAARGQMRLAMSSDASQSKPSAVSRAGARDEGDRRMSASPVCASKPGIGAGINITRPILRQVIYASSKSPHQRGNERRIGGNDAANGIEYFGEAPSNIAAAEKMERRGAWVA